METTNKRNKEYYLTLKISNLRTDVDKIESH